MLTSIDTLFDTRLVMVDILNPNYIKENTDYHVRLRDNFGNMSYGIFKTFYDLRNKNLLKNCLHSNIYTVINQHFYMELNDIDVSNDYQDFKLYVNTYPYELTKAEEDMLLESIKPLLKISNFEFIHMKPIEITPKWVNKHVNTILLYDGLEWLSHVVTTKSFISDPIIDKLIIAPAIINGYLDRPINKEVLETIIKSLSVTTQLMFIDVKYFNPVL